MTTPLFWETCRIVNTSYENLLRYPAPLQIDPKTQTFRFVTTFSELTAFYFSLLVITVIIVATLDVVVEGIVIGSLKLPLILCIMHFVAFCASMGILILLLIVITNADAFWEQYFNCVVALEHHILLAENRSKYPDFSMQNYLIGLKAGNLG